MMLLRSLVGDAQTLLDLHPADLAGYILQVLVPEPSSPNWNRRSFCNQAGYDFADGKGQFRDDVARACAEAWAWLEMNGLICQNYDQDAGWYVVTRRGAVAADREKLQALVKGEELPESFIHPLFLLHVRPLFLQGRFETAVFEAFKTLEIRIRDLSGFGPDKLGVQLVSAAFDPKRGPLRNPFAEGGEREALRHLLAGAIGSYKNPASHRRVAVHAHEARDMITIASHLLYIVEMHGVLFAPASPQGSVAGPKQ
jgi:uncharacterized protein (TIGR02391 family)